MRAISSAERRRWPSPGIQLASRRELTLCTVEPEKTSSEPALTIRRDALR